MEPRRPLLRLTLAALAGFACLAPAIADTITLKDGTVIEGRAVIEGETIAVYHRGKKRVFAKSEVASVVTPRQAFQARFKTLDKTLDAKTSLREHLALVSWCAARRLRRETKQVREAILVRWPNHAGTRKALGYVVHKGRWITRAEYMRDLGLVEDGGKQSWITPQDRAAAEARAKAAPKIKEVAALCRKLSRKGADVTGIGKKIAAYSDLAAAPALESALLSESLKVRLFAAGELGRRKAKASQVRLAYVAYKDSKSKARKAALQALKKIGPTKAREVFIRGLRSKSVFESGHAAGALAMFPTRRAIPVLIHRLRESTSGFGVVSMSVVTQRAYIQDFELTSGGNGQQSAEVADPVVGTSTEGISLEVKVIQWYREAVISALHRTTGRTFGGDAARWEAWWKAQEGK
ncbi:MAG: HEAT repeat domain-containing protein [Planctomycetes bacterium]|nr:HEAT repeat domain-containing protein [Planctomycetota bacterium]